MGVDEKLKNFHLRQHIGSIKHKQFMHHDVSIILDLGYCGSGIMK